jgi:CRP/FNR family cyclic AMP-dependent transcriptional regulator
VLERFEGPSGRRVLLEAIERQSLVRYKRDVAERIADTAKLQQWSAGERIIEQGSSERGLYLILMGSVSIQVNGRERATREAGQYVGEMSLIDPHLSPAASVFARETTVTARLSEPDFSDLGEAHPFAWRSLASELANALRRGNQEVRGRNQTPVLFVGSSSESLPIVQALQQGLANDPFEVRPWTAGVFGASTIYIEALENQLNLSDFAILVMGPDDVVQSRGRTTAAPQDNVVFELGLFMGVLGRKRTFIIAERGKDFKIPSDLLGLVLVEFPPGDASTLSERISTACESIRQRVTQLGPL